MNRRIGVALGLLSVGSMVWAEAASAAVFQYRLPVARDKGEASALVWIPPAAKQVRGVILSGMTLMEAPFVRGAHIRAACADQELALIFLTCGLGATDLQKVLDGAAQASGYREFSVAPLMFVGHSAGGPQAQQMAVKMASRCFALAQYRGGMPSRESPIEPGIPSVAMMAQFDEFWGGMRNADGLESWQRARDYIVGFRAANERNLGSFVVEPGAGHFGWSERNSVYLSLFIRKAAQARIPAAWPTDATAPVVPLRIDHATGWLTGFNLEAAPECASFADYKGDKAKTSWHFDEEMARATMAYHQGLLGKKDQFLKWQDPVWVDAGTRFFQTALKWVGDGQTVEVHPVYADKYPAQQGGQGPRWEQAGQPVGHSETPIRVKPVSGPIVAVSPNWFRLQCDALSPAGSGGGGTFLAYSEGNAEYRYTEQVGMLPRGFKGLGDGKAQTITFAPLTNLKADSKPVKLEATSDAGLPVEFYVAYGPATVVEGQLTIADLPARAKRPIEVKVVAYQFGRGLDPKVKTAAPVERTLLVE